MSPRRCRHPGCPLVVNKTRCEVHAKEHSERENLDRALKAITPPGASSRCTMLDHTVDECTWQPSILANWKTPQQARAEAVRA